MDLGLLGDTGKLGLSFSQNTNWQVASCCSGASALLADGAPYLGPNDYNRIP
jgi:hypothetical protein